MNKVQSTDVKPDRLQHSFPFIWYFLKHGHQVNHVGRHSRWYLIDCDAPLPDIATFYDPYLQQDIPKLIIPNTDVPETSVLFQMFQSIFSSTETSQNPISATVLENKVFNYQLTF